MSANIDKSITSYVVDNETGEPITALYTGDRILRATSIEHLKNYKVINDKHKFVKVFSVATDILAKINLTPSESSIIFAMINNIGYGAYSGYLIKYEHKLFSSFLNEADLQAKTNIKRRAFLTAIIELEAKEIIYLEQDTYDKRCNRILVNPFIFMAGQEITIKLYDTFKGSKWNYLGQ